MSSAFLKNETADAPVVIPARAFLPPGMPNYVTLKGLELLRTELVELENERSHWQGRDVDEPNERSRQLALLNGRIAQLQQRIASAKLVDAQQHEPDRVRFGATVVLKATKGPLAGREQRYRIVGVDQANATQGLLSFTAPLARVLQGKRIGELVSLPGQMGQQIMEVFGIEYEPGS